MRAIDRVLRPTFVTFPPGSLAVAVIVIVGFQGKIAPSAGDVMFAVGAVFAELTVIVAGALVVLVPRLSVARAVTVTCQLPRHSR